MTNDSLLIEKTFFELIRDEILLPGLYKPVACLNSFIFENKHLFTLIGVFGAVSAYLRPVNNGVKSPSILSDIAVVAGLALVTILSLIVVVNLLIELRRVGKWEGAGLLFFAAFFTPLIIVITGLLTTFPQVWAIYYFMTTYGLGLLTASLAMMTALILGKAIDDFLDNSSPVFKGISVLLLAFVISYLIIDSNRASSQLWSQSLATGGISPKAWLNIYIDFSLAFGALYSYAAVALFALEFFLKIASHLLSGTVHWLRRSSEF